MEVRAKTGAASMPARRRVSLSKGYYSGHPFGDEWLAS